MKSAGKVHDVQSAGLNRRAEKAIFAAVNTDRCSNSLDYLNARLDCKISAKDVNGDYCIYDTVRTAPGGPPLHIHHDQDEWFFVSEGQFIFQVGDERFRLTAGDSVLGPRKVPHAFANVSETGRLLILYQPAGTIEQFFLDSQYLSKSSSPTLDAWQAVAHRHRIEILGPPLKLE